MADRDQAAATFRPPYRYEPSRHGPVTIYDSVDVGWIARVKESLPHKEALARAMVDGLNAASTGTVGGSEVCYVCGALQIVCRCPGGPTEPPSEIAKRGAATSRVEPGADSVQLNPESAPASSAATTDAEWERLIDRLTAIGDGHLADRTITPGEAQMLLARIGSLQVWAIGALARELNRV